MRADNSHVLRKAAQRRRQATYDRARAALRRLATTGTPVTFDVVAREAAVSRAWLYAEPEIRQAIEQLRATTTRSARSPAVPSSQRASDASLIQRLQVATDRNRQLTSEVKDLREQLARLHGELRSLQQCGSGLQKITAGGRRELTRNFLSRPYWRLRSRGTPPVCSRV